MAITTRSKRSAVISFLQPSKISLPSPDGVINQFDRIQLAYGYGAVIRPISSINTLSGLRRSRARFPAH